MTDHHAGHAEHADHDDADEAALAELLDLDGEVLRSYWTDALSWVRDAVGTTGRLRVLDLGAGTGVGTIALAQQFEDAEVIAVDASAEMLDRIRAKAAGGGLADRIRTVQADLDVALPAVDPVDLSWASMSLHHLTDPDRLLAEVFAATRPGGLIAVAEFSEPLRVLPDDVGVGSPGLEARLLEILGAEHAQSVPELGSDWAPRLEAAGFGAVAERTFEIELGPPSPPGAARYAGQWLRRLRSGLADRLAPDDLAALDTLIDGDDHRSVQQRNDLQIRGTRTVTVATR